MTTALPGCGLCARPPRLAAASPDAAAPPRSAPLSVVTAQLRPGLPALLHPSGRRRNFSPQLLTPNQQPTATMAVTARWYCHLRTFGPLFQLTHLGLSPQLHGLLCIGQQVTTLTPPRS